MSKVNEINEKLIKVLGEKIQLLEEQKAVKEKIIEIQKEQLFLCGVGSSLFMLLDEDNEPVMPLVLDEQKAIETRLKYLKDGTRKAITINRVEVI